MKFVTVMRRPFAIFGPREKVRENTIFEPEIVKQVFDIEQTFPHALEFCWGWQVRSSSKRSCVTTFLISNDESFLRIQPEPPEQKTLVVSKFGQSTSQDLRCRTPQQLAPNVMGSGVNQFLRYMVSIIQPANTGQRGIFLGWLFPGLSKVLYWLGYSI